MFEILKAAWRTIRGRKIAGEELERNLDAGKLFPPTEYDHMLVWGNDRRAQGPLELRVPKGKKDEGPFEWRYQPLSVEENQLMVFGGGRDQEAWSSEPIPAEIAGLFQDLCTIADAAAKLNNKS